MTNKINVLFFLFKAKGNKNKEAPIYRRLTMNKKRKHISTGYKVPAEDWDVDTHTVRPTNPFHTQINTKLNRIKGKVYDLTLKYEDEHK